MKVKIEFDTSNSAFADDFGGELFYILGQARRKVQEQLDRPKAVCDAPEATDKLLDSNGNTVGSVEVLHG